MFERRGRIALRHVLGDVLERVVAVLELVERDL